MKSTELQILVAVQEVCETLNVSRYLKIDGEPSTPGRDLRIRLAPSGVDFCPVDISVKEASYLFVEIGRGFVFEFPFSRPGKDLTKASHSLVRLLVAAVEGRIKERVGKLGHLEVMREVEIFFPEGAERYRDGFVLHRLLARTWDEAVYQPYP